MVLYKTTWLKTDINNKTMREPFKLRSGNKTSFKMMGSSPVKKLVGKQKNIDVNNNNRIDAQDFEMLRQKDYIAEVCYDLDSAISVIETYMGGFIKWE